MPKKSMNPNTSSASRKASAAASVSGAAKGEERFYPFAFFPYFNEPKRNVIFQEENSSVNDIGTHTSPGKKYNLKNLQQRIRASGDLSFATPDEAAKYAQEAEGIPQSYWIIAQVRDGEITQLYHSLDYMEGDQTFTRSFTKKPRDEFLNSLLTSQNLPASAPQGFIPLMPGDDPLSVRPAIYDQTTNTLYINKFSVDPVAYQTYCREIDEITTSLNKQQQQNKTDQQGSKKFFANVAAVVKKIFQPVNAAMEISAAAALKKYLLDLNFEELKSHAKALTKANGVLIQITRDVLESDLFEKLRQFARRPIPRQAASIMSSGQDQNGASLGGGGGGEEPRKNELPEDNTPDQELLPMACAASAAAAASRNNQPPVVPYHHGSLSEATLLTNAEAGGEAQPGYKVAGSVRAVTASAVTASAASAAASPANTSSQSQRLVDDAYERLAALPPAPTSALPAVAGAASTAGAESRAGAESTAGNGARLVARNTAENRKAAEVPTP
jgi:hypothetical protein